MTCECGTRSPNAILQSYLFCENAPRISKKEILSVIYFLFNMNLNDGEEKRKKERERKRERERERERYGNLSDYRFESREKRVHTEV